MKLVAVAAAVVAVVVILILVFGGKGGDSLSDTLPTQRVMTTDAKSVLSSLDVAGSVVDLTVIDDSMSERFKTYTAECIVTVASNGEETDYNVTLYYEFEDEQWSLITNMCNITK